MIKRLVFFLDRLNGVLIRAVKGLLCVILAFQVLLIFGSVVMRYFLNRPLAWSDELATFLLVYVTFLGAYVPSNTGHLARVELFVGLLHGPKMYFSNIIQNQVSSAMQIPMKLIWWILPLTMWLLLLTELMGILHLFIPREGGKEYVPLD